MSNERIMTKIMNLLNLAADPSASEAERKLAEERADALMAQHMIDRMDLKPEEKSKIIEDTWEVLVTDENLEFGTTIISLMRDVIIHCGIKLHPNCMTKLTLTGTNYTFRLVGFPEDIAYGERIWFRIFKALVTNINPTWDASKGLSDNVYEMIRAGFSWQDIHDRAYRARADHYGLPPRGQGGGSKLHNAYKEALEARGEEWHVTRQNKKYRASFARSFQSTMRKRLDAIREASKNTVSDKDKFALALVDTESQVLAEFYRLYPDLDPENQQKRREEQMRMAMERLSRMDPEEVERIRKAQEEEYKRQAKIRERELRKFRSMRNHDQTDHHAWNRGSEAAKKVDLNDFSEVNEDKMGELL